MARLLSNLVNNILKEFINLNVNTYKWEICGITYKVRGCFLEYTNFKDDLIECKSLYLTKVINKRLSKN